MNTINTPNTHLPTPPIIDQKPMNFKRRKVGGFVVVLLLVAVIAGGAILVTFARKTAETAPLQTLSSLHYPSQLPQAQALCTAQGYVLLQQLAAQPDWVKLLAFPATSVKSTPLSRDVEMIFETAEGKSHLFVRMVNQNGWKFHDIYLAEAKGKQVGLWFSYVHEHPFLSLMQMNSGEIIQGIDKTVQTTKGILEVVEMCKRLSEKRQTD